MLALSLLTFSVSCATVTPVTSCGAFSIITISKRDVLTDETARLILKHNRTYEAVCGG